MSAYAVPLDALALLGNAELPRSASRPGRSIVLPATLRAVLVHIAVHQGELLSLLDVAETIDVGKRCVYEAVLVAERHGLLRDLHPDKLFVTDGRRRGRRYVVEWGRLRELSARGMGRVFRG